MHLVLVFCYKGRGKPFASCRILLKKDVEGQGEPNKQGKEGGKEENGLAEDSEEDVVVNAEMRQVAQSEKESGPSKQN